MSDGWLLDNSAWVRLDSVGLARDRSDWVADALEAGRLHSSTPFLLEAGYSARSADEWAETLTGLRTLPEAHIDAVVERRAVDAHQQLIAEGIHRQVPPVDLLLAALAERHKLRLLHYDADFDVLAQRTDLGFAAEWLAPAGQLT